MTWIGAERGIFTKRGLAIRFPPLEVGGPESAAGLARGDWDFVQTGTTPIMDAVLSGWDAVIVAMPTESCADEFVMAKREITNPQQLNGRRIGVLTVQGQTGVLTRLFLDQSGVTGTLVPLGTYRKIYDALAVGEIDAGYLPIDFRYLGERSFEWNAFEAPRSGIRPILATTRKLIANNRELVARFVQGFIESTHFFKTHQDAAVPLLQRFLQFSERDVVDKIYRFYVPQFRIAPRPSFPGFQVLRDYFSETYPAAQTLRQSDIADPSFVEELERNGFIEKLGKSGSKQ
jgi:ABC-type nitrate/sulfonate/bicarbonate transport system substrate-binding protein